MLVKIQGGGGGNYTNSGSSYGAVTYLKHEDAQRQEHGKEVEPFFNQDKNVSSKNIVKNLDSNKAKLCKEDAKFYVMTVSPSESEIRAMGKTPEEQSAAFKEYIRNDVMEKYASNFNKGLDKNDIMYYGKIHHERKNDGQKLDMHAHILISRKTMDNTKKISPQTNHKSAENSGIVRSGFNRAAFYRQAEESFDKRFNYEREYKNSFEYQNAMKNGSVSEKQEVIKKNVEQEAKIANEQSKLQNQEQKVEREKNKNKNLNIGL